MAGKMKFQLKSKTRQEQQIPAKQLHEPTTSHNEQISELPMTAVVKPRRKQEIQSESLNGSQIQGTGSCIVNLEVLAQVKHPHT